MDYRGKLAVSPPEEDRYRLLVDAISDHAIYMLDPDGRVASWNTGAERIKGYEPDEIIGADFARFFTAADREAGLPQQMLDLAAREGRSEAEGWRVRKDGTQFWGHVTIDRIVTAKGEPRGFATVTRDLTEKRATDEQLRQSQEQFRLLVQSVTDYAIYMLDPKGNVASWNAGAERIKGYAAQEIIGQHFSRFYGDDDRQRGAPEEALAAAFREGRFEREGWRYRKDGTRFWANVIIDAIRNEAGELIGYAKVTRDITERLEAQRQLETAREALFQAQKMEAIGQLTGGVAHDFNNLLMAILGSLEIASKRLAYDPRVTPFLQNAIQGAQRGATLTRRMLAFARRQELKMEPVDVAALVSDMGELIESALGPSVRIVTRFTPGLPKALTDPSQLESSILNLAVNARDAMPKGGQIVIEALRRTVGESARGGIAAGDYVVLSVADEGEGMDEATLARATEPFFTTKGIGKGTGLGLSMVHGMAEQSGGRLVLKSEKGRGTTAEIWLPVANGTGAVVRPGVAVTEQPEKRALSVLAVDDDPLVLMNTTAMLEELGHEVLDATSGREALSILERQPVDLVITDHAMPQMTGVELARIIAGRWPEVKLIVATGYAELPDGTVPNRLLTKPFSTQDLRSAIATVAS